MRKNIQRIWPCDGRVFIERIKQVINTILYDEEIKKNIFLCTYFMQFYETNTLYICCRL